MGRFDDLVVWALATGFGKPKFDWVLLLLIKKIILIFGHTRRCIGSISIHYISCDMLSESCDDTSHVCEFDIHDKILAIYRKVYK